MGARHRHRGRHRAGTVSLWDHEWDGETIDEIGWMVLPEHQGRGLASTGVAEALRRADEAARWRVLHAFPATTNAPSNALCRKHGFALRGPIDYTYRGAEPAREPLGARYVGASVRLGGNGPVASDLTGRCSGERWAD